MCSVCIYCTHYSIASVCFVVVTLTNVLSLFTYTYCKQFLLTHFSYSVGNITKVFSSLFFPSVLNKVVVLIIIDSLTRSLTSVNLINQSLLILLPVMGFVYFKCNAVNVSYRRMDQKRNGVRDVNNAKQKRSL